MEKRMKKMLVASIAGMVCMGLGACAAEPAHQHSYTTTVVAATCENGGHTLFACECGDSYQGEETAALGHEYGEWVTVLEPTYETEGKKEQKCRRCDAGLSESIPKLAPHEHTCEEETTQPTCTEKGISRQICQDCGLIVSENEIAALGHAWSSWEVTKKATTSEAGSKTRTCSACQETETASIPKVSQAPTPSTKPAEPQPTPTPSTPAGHQHVFTETVVAPTCTEGGYTLRQCACGKTEKTDSTHKRGHLYGDWKYLTTATLTREGYREATCTRCGNVLGEKVDKLNPAYAHKYENVDDRIVVRTYGNGVTAYTYNHVSVADSRTWGGTPIIEITSSGGFNITYYKQDGTEVSYYLRLVEGYTNSLTILEDGSYVTQLFGDYKD